jgi:hypothetical protein
MGNWVATGNEIVADKWIEHNQKLFNRDEVWFRVFKENGGWSPIPAGAGMFGAPPQDPGVWNHKWLKGHWDEENKEELRVRPEHINKMNRAVTEWFFRRSHETGCGFELCIIATLKHTDHVGNGHIDHIIRQELLMFTDMQSKYPKAKVIASACNEWDAHHVRHDPWNRRVQFSLWGVNMWATRRGRDKLWSGQLIVDHGGRDTFDYKVGKGDDTYDWGMLHPVRGGRDWRLAPKMGPIIAACNGQPYGATESMYYVDPEDKARAEQWYRSSGWQTNPDDQMMLYGNLEKAGFSYIIIHDEKGAQSDPIWPRDETRLESRLREKFGGTTVGLRYERIIQQAYREILGRDADEGGLIAYNNAMWSGMEEWELRESMIRSPEYNKKNPEER